MVSKFKIIMSLLKHIIQLDKPACCAPKIMFLKGYESAFRGGTLSYMKNLLINHPIVFLIESPLNIFFRLFCLVVEDLYNDGAIGVDGSVCRTLCDFCIRLDGLLGCEDLPIAVMQKKKKKNQSTLFYT